MYHFGDRFVIKSTDKYINNDELLLAQVEGNKMSLIMIGVGNRIHDPIQVFDTTNITDTEMSEMIGGYCSLDELHKTVCGKIAFHNHLQNKYGIEFV